MNNLFSNILVSCPNGGGLFLLDQGSYYKLDATNTTGIFFTNGVLLRAIQPASLAFCGQQAIEVDKSIVFDDVHDVMAIHQHYYLVGTTNNEVIKFSPDGTELQRWVFPGENDAMHLNCLGTWGERIVFSAFGDFHHTREYKGQSVGAGFVQDLYTGERLIEGLSQPHSLLQMGDNLLVASSEDREIREYSPSGELVRSYRFDGYPRGIALLNGVIYVGLSRSRNIDDQGVNSARLVALDCHSFHELGAIDLPVREIYSVVAIDDPMQLVRAVAACASRTSAVYEQRLVTLEQQQSYWISEVKQALGDRYLADDPLGVDSVKQMMHAQTETIADLQGTVASYQAENASLEAQVASLGQQLSDRENVCGLLTQQLAEKEAHLETIAPQLAEKEAHLETLTQQLAAKEVHLETLTQQLAAKEEHLETLTQQLAAKEEHLETLTQQLAAKEADLETLTQQLAAKEADLETLTQQLAAKEEHLETLTQQLAAKEADLETLTQQLAAKEDQSEGLSQQIFAKEKQLDGLTTLLGSQEEMLVSLRNDIAALSNAKEKACIQHGHEVTSLEQHVASRDSILDAMAAEKALLETQLASKDQYLASMEERLAALTAQLLAGEQAAGVLHNEIQRQDAALHEQEERFQHVVHSYSWQLTKPLRFLARLLRGDWQAIGQSPHYLAVRRVVTFPKNAVRAVYYGVRHYGSFSRCLRAAFSVWRREGIAGLRKRSRQLNQLNGR
ncbi:DUF4915 domain-containing protein [Dickeya lacustris]|uniref:DUF4915 domain-containing protein n=1 Tax=Dickeya lacustris TaxID=2259638 RepID=A0ABY8G2H0_9GAMM|nr:DUF4915 domain-containing protein [Dickeya lacustris]WFN54076.1 DUF4915 domain-containing protein [Dickeya lacustris]